MWADLTRGQKLRNKIRKGKAEENVGVSFFPTITTANGMGLNVGLELTALQTNPSRPHCVWLESDPLGHNNRSPLLLCSLLLRTSTSGRRDCTGSTLFLFHAGVQGTGQPQART